MGNYVFITKDAMCREYLPIYGNEIFKTPNIDELAKKGTVFYNHFTSAPSTVMSFYGMATGIWAHDTEYEMYEKKEYSFTGETIFTKLAKRGIESHILWDDMWDVLPKYVNYFDKVEIHSLKKFRQGVGAHYSHEGFLKPDEKKEKEAFGMVENAVKQILSGKDNVFLWLHCPHVIYGRVSYGSDIELFDKYVEMVRKYVTDECIAISADHGNMNGKKNKICYGYDVYSPNILIPLITPRIEGVEEYHANTSNVDLFDILFDKKIPSRKFVYSDSAYRAQSHRKLAIIYDKYKYIYNKQNKTEELYDLEFDSNEEFSIMEDYVYDPDRKIKAPSRELYFYPEWTKLPHIRKIMRSEKERIWKNGSFKVVTKSKVKDMIRPIYVTLTRKKSK